MAEETDPSEEKARRREAITKWKAAVAPFEKPSAPRASWQIASSIGAYLALWCAMYFTHSISWALTIPLAILAGGLLVRIFIIFHDCGHGSFFSSRRANNFWGFISGMLVFTPYFHWRWEHSVHHATSGDLDKRGTGDVWTLTVAEYLEASRWKKFAYHFVRNPIFLFFIGPLLLFLVRERFPTKGAAKREVRSVWMMNLAIFSFCGALISLFGFLPWMIIQLTAVGVAFPCGVWMFYVQHQYEDTYWERGDDWDYTTAAIHGSSFYKLPKVLQWFTGNIGFHHVHHLSAKIPNYHLEKCHLSDPMFNEVEPLTLLTSLKSITYRLWDEKTGKLISFRQFRKLQRERAAEIEAGNSSLSVGA